MFTISPVAYAALEAAAETDFVSRLCNVLREAVPSLSGESQASLRDNVIVLIRQAREHGFASEQAIGGFAVTAGLLGLDFVQKFPGAQQILASSESGDRKAQLLEAFTLDILERLEG